MFGSKKINRIISFKKKVILFFTIFVVGLLSIILLFTYLSSVQLIKSEADKNLATIMKLYEGNFHSEVKKTIIELSNLGAKISTIGADGIGKEMEKFILNYSMKYELIDIFLLRNKIHFSAKPVRLFTGETKVVFGKQSFPPNLKLSLKDESQFEIDDKNISFSIQMNGSNILTASTHLDYYSEQIIQSMGLAADFQTSLVSNNGTVINSSEKSFINQSIKNVTGDESLFMNNAQDIYSQYELRRSIIHYSPKLKLYLWLTLDIRNELENIDKLFFRISSFSFVVLILLFAILFLFLKQFSRSLSELTEISKSVSNGDFTKQININRNDELGILINSFNEMIVKLKQSYEVLDKTNVDLAEKIDELMKTKNELSEAQRLAVIGETMSKISHEIQNKISGISLWIQNLEMQLTANDPSMFYIKEIKGALKTFLDMLYNFKKFYRKSDLSLTPVDLHKLASRVCDELKNDIARKSITVIKKFDEEGKIILADEQQLKEVFENLMANAIYHTPHGKKIYFSINKREEFILIHVEDEGNGILEINQDKIFEPFYTTNPSGSGLGLSIVKNIIDKHGAEVKAYNSINGGAVFEIIFHVTE